MSLNQLQLILLVAGSGLKRHNVTELYRDLGHLILVGCATEMYDFSLFLAVR